MEDFSIKPLEELVHEEDKLPFYGLDDDQDIRFEYGYPPRPLQDFEFKHHANRQVFNAPSPGNFLRGKVMKDLRVGTKRNGKNRFVLDLTSILNLPVELVLEIFQHLHPIDLFHLTQTSKSLRQFLLARRMETFWQTVYDRNPEIPSCPEEISTPRWTYLLFGEPICQECKINRGMLNFYLRRQLCERCTLDLCLTYLSSEEQISREHPDLIETFMRILSPVELHAGRVYASPDTCTVWHLESEVFEKQQRLIALSEATTDGDPEAVAALAKFEEECKADAAKLRQFARRGAQWGYEVIQAIEASNKLSITSFSANCISQLINLGHDPQEAHQHSIEFALMPYRPLRFSQRNFRRYLPVMEAELAVRKARRLERERERLVARRIDAVSDLWTDYRRTRHPGECASYQATEEIVAEFGLFREYIADESTTFQALERARAFTAFDQLVSEWEDDCKRRLVLASYEASYGISPRRPNAALLTPQNLSRMQLAVSVYTCQTCKANHGTKSNGSLLLGISEAMLHMKCMFGSTHSRTFECNYRGAAAVKSLLQLLDLDPNMTLRRDLDRLDARFVCMNCFDNCLSARSGLVNALIWRECIVHEVSMSHGGPCEWALLSAEASRSIRLVEEVWPSPDEYMWYCNHCPLYYLAPNRFDTVAIHVETDHGIVIPTLDVDVGYVLETSTNNRQPYGIAPDESYRCRLCSGLDRLELRKYDALINEHFPEVHPDDEPAGNNIEHIDLIERVSPRGTKW